jgi:CMP-N-acetylneuraminic acid synthetase
MRVLGLIPARGGSVRVPRKNLQQVGGIPLLAHAMLHCRGSKLLTDWRVSTDSVDVALGAVFLDGNVRRVLSRNKSAGDVPIIDVIREALEDMKDADLDAICLVQPTSPFREPKDIDACIERLTPGVRSVVSVDAETGKRNGAVYVARLEMLRDGYVFDAESVTYRMPHARSMDVNTVEDLAEARRMAG